MSYAPSTRPRPPRGTEQKPSTVAGTGGARGTQHRRRHVSVVWCHDRGTEKRIVRVLDRREGNSVEIPEEPHLALYVYDHPSAYQDFGRRSVEQRLVA